MEDTLPNSLGSHINVKIDGKGIKRLRERELKLSQERFALLLSVSAKTVSRWENDESKPIGANLQHLQNLYAMMTLDKKLRHSFLTMLSERGGIETTSSILGALNMVFLGRSSQSNGISFLRDVLENQFAGKK